MRINFNELFTVTDAVVIPKVLINIMSIIRGGPELRLERGTWTINGVDPVSWQGKDLLVDIRTGSQGKEYYIRGLAVA
ncbi:MULTISPECIES: hypothetical protein [Spirosoma]|uniref:Uncharacterized protein n=1 Tax=Spirosoma liriopis TaxID=2937440 RepID=A0ABT0HTI6_9BACT|nr:MULTISPECIES: hypothetical protein [Spirosoma]MCK8495495.1 hypothetical protein [Spirosoma liriopis]UHG94507.1 hypothetical protein LQ777_28375 [Spirosoma oryzicola]